MFQGKVIVLVNSETQSRAEFTTMCYQTADNVITIGSQTSGADGNISRIQLVNGIVTAMTSTGVFYPDGTETQRNGVRIDQVVKPTVEGIKAGRDEVIDKAIEIAKLG